MRACTAEEFLADVANHRMRILLNNAIYRHIHFRSAERGWNQWFDLITWPGCLTISGDMGTWTFSRVTDMFTFFRSSGGLKINESYWAEKLQHGNFSGRQGGKVWDQDAFQSRQGGKVWDQDAFQSSVLARLKARFEDEPEKLAEITGAVEEEIFRRHDGDGPHMMRHALYEWSYEFEADRWRTGYDHQRTWKFQFDGMDIPDGMEYSYHFIWCLYAIVWGIQRYDLGEVAHASIPVVEDAA